MGLQEEGIKYQTGSQGRFEEKLPLLPGSITTIMAMSILLFPGETAVLSVAC